MVRQVEEALLQIGWCEKGDRVVIVAGTPPGTPGKTNALRGALHRRRRGPERVSGRFLVSGMVPGLVPRVGFEPTLHGF